MRSLPHTFALALLVVTALSGPLFAVRPAEKPRRDFDAAGGLRIGLATGAALQPVQSAAMHRLEIQSGAKLRVRWNGLSRVPRTLGADKPLSSPSDAAPEGIARGFVRQHRDVWGLSDTEVDALRFDTSYTDEHSGLTHVFYTQTADGVPVFPATVGVHLDGRGRVLGVEGDLFPGTRRRGGARLTAEQAAEKAADQVGVDFRAHRRGTEGDAVVLERGRFRDEVKVSPILYPLLGGPARLAYRMTLAKNGREWYDVLVDASDGTILHLRNLYVEAGQLTPSAPAESSPATPRAQVFIEHPLATVRGTGDFLRKYPLTADPLGGVRGFANAPQLGADTQAVIAHGGDPKNASVAQMIQPLPDAAQPLRSNRLPLGTTPQSPQGWFIKQGGRYLTIGNNVDAKDDQADDDEATAGHRADGGLNGDFTGGSFVFRNLYAQNGPYAEEAPLAVASAERLAGAVPDLDAAVTNLFYLTNWYHDFLYHLGFTEAAGNFQKDNFGRGGLANDALFADAQDGSGTNNANFGTPPDGSNPRMQMYLFSGPERDGAFDSDVVLHEFTHGLSNRLIGGPNNTDCLGLGLVGESGGMGEGWSDFYAASVTDEPALGEYVVDSPVNGIRRFSMDAGPDDFTYGFICTGPPSNPSLIPCEVHDVGEFWSIVLWEMREAMINRFHNRAFPGGPTFPTFALPAGSPSSNIRDAQGRTTDGSHAAARIDNAAIENGSFSALFRVTDGMKLTVCNPTMVDARDGILAADRASGGEFQDVIWRAFANRGLGAAAASTGNPAGGAQGLPGSATVEDFTVPATVAACEAAGGPLPAPSFTATSIAPNSVRVTITPNGATQYVVYRGVKGAGTPVEPVPFVEVGRTSGTVFLDSGLDGGVAYTYRVRAIRNDDCVSGSSAVTVTPLGAALPCTADPAFLGLTRVIDAADCQHLLLDWPQAASSCAGGQAVRYNVYRGTTPDFTVGAASRIATGLVGNSYVDAPGANDRLFYYIVRAEDSTTGHGGPANGGNEDDNTVRRAGLVTSALLTNQGFLDDVETGPDDQTSAHFTSSGLTVPLIPERGGWFRDADPAPATAHSPVTVWHTFNADNVTLSASNNLAFELRSDVMTIDKQSILTWWQTFQAEGGFDGGVVEYALVDATTGTAGTFQDLGALIYENGYNGALTATSAGTNTNPLFGRQAYTGGTIGPMKRARAFLGGLVPASQSTQRIVIRYLFGNDVANTIPPSTPEGNYLPGWYVDDVSLDEACCPMSPAPLNLTAAASGDNQVTLTWQAPASGAPAQYQILREEAGEGTPVVFDEPIATVPGAQTTYVDTQATAGVTYAYVVRALPASGCPSGNSNVARVTATGRCTTDPFFLGLGAVNAPPAAGCTLVLSWDEGSARCPGATVRYNVYRGTDPGFTPALENAVALGLTGLAYTDTAGLASGTTYYYVVRAEDTTSNDGGPANGGNEDDNLVRRAASPQGALVPGPSFSDNVESGSQTGYTATTTRTVGGWQVLPDPTAHSATHAWVATDDQPGVPTLTSIDDRLLLPPMNLTSASILSFSHNFDFAQDPLGPEYHSGGVVEVSGDGGTWVDLGPYITSGGGYNGSVDPTAMSPLNGRPAFVGSSDAVPGTRVDAMHPVTVDVGSALVHEFGVTSLPGARIRFRLGGTFQILIGGLQGSGWGIDDLGVTGLQTNGACSTVPATPCSISGVSPASGAQGSNVNVTVSGAHFAAGSNVVFSSDGHADDGVSEGPATVNGAGTQVTLAIAIASDAPEGPRDVTVLAPNGGFCVSRSAFTVTKAGASGGSRRIPCDDPSISRKGGWHAIADARSGFGQYCRNVGANKGNSTAFLEVPIQTANGGTVSIVYARGPRGGDAAATAGSDSRTIDFFRPAADPTHPDNSGRNDLTFGYSETFNVPPGGGTLRLDVRNVSSDPQRDMDFVEGFIFTEAQSPSTAGRYQETATTNTGTIPPGGSVTRTQNVSTGTVLLTVLADALAGHDLALRVVNPLGVALPAPDDPITPDTAQVLSIVPGRYTITVTNKGTTAAPYALIVVPTLDLARAPSVGTGTTTIGTVRTP
ncbi:MAG TPA: M36 family metallopeptidase [Candidatus Polarisedimenticolia bacterium]|nr:M36 family metallopeptidase [Candidatus Polarisedimenticolia bacterium]